MINTPVRMVKITGLAPDISTTMIEMFIEKKSGESELESCDFDADIGVAVVGFKSPQGSINLSVRITCNVEWLCRTYNMCSEVTVTENVKINVI